MTKIDIAETGIWVGCMLLCCTFAAVLGSLFGCAPLAVSVGRCQRDYPTSLHVAPLSHELDGTVRSMMERFDTSKSIGSPVTFALQQHHGCGSPSAGVLTIMTVYM